MNITKNARRGNRVHALVVTYRDLRRPRSQPLCGGGYQARSAQWQEVLLDINCERCLALIDKQKQKAKP